MGPRNLDIPAGPAEYSKWRSKVNLGRTAAMQWQKSSQLSQLNSYPTLARIFLRQPGHFSKRRCCRFEPAAKEPLYKFFLAFFTDIK